MRIQKNALSIIGASALMILLILSASTARTAAAEGIELCLQVIIPSLFPFFVITTYLNKALLDFHIPGSSVLRRFLRVPEGCEAMLIVGLLGGYPVGAQLVADAFDSKSISKRTAQILLGYFSNAGPAFLFGVAGSLFSSMHITISLWIIHILSASITGYLLPHPQQENPVTFERKKCSLAQAIQKGISVCATVCAWVILFKISMAYFEKLLPHSTNPVHYTIIMGSLELSNGFILLQSLECEYLRFVIASVFLAFGGICVILQTISVTEQIGLGLYLPGKGIQTCLSFLLSMLISPILFPGVDIPTSGFILSLLCIAVIVLLRSYCKKRCGNPENNHV